MQEPQQCAKDFTDIETGIRAGIGAEETAVAHYWKIAELASSFEPELGARAETVDELFAAVERGARARGPGRRPPECPGLAHEDD